MDLKNKISLLMEDWSLLCKEKSTKDIVLSKLREIGLCTHIKHAVQSKIEEESIKLDDLEETVHTTVNNPGSYIHSLYI